MNQEKPSKAAIIIEFIGWTGGIYLIVLFSFANNWSRPLSAAVAALIISFIIVYRAYSSNEDKNDTSRYY